MSAGAASLTAYPDHAPVRWRLATYDDGQVGLYGSIKGVGDIGFLADPADVLRELDNARQLVIDHLVAAVGIPTSMATERQLLADILREDADGDLPSDLRHRIRSVLAGDQPQPTGRTTVAALTERRSVGDLHRCAHCTGTVYPSPNGRWAHTAIEPGAAPHEPEPEGLVAAGGGA